MITIFYCRCDSDAIVLDRQSFGEPSKIAQKLILLASLKKQTFQDKLKC